MRKDMELKQYNDKCVRITTVPGEVFEGTAAFDSAEYALHEYGRDQEALRISPIVFYRDDIADIISLEDVNGPFGHYSERYGLLERKCLEWGTDLIEEVLDSEDDVQIMRMLACMNDNLPSIADRAVAGMAPWRSGGSIPESEETENEEGPVYLGELEKMLGSLVNCSRSNEVVKEAKRLLDRLGTFF